MTGDVGLRARPWMEKQDDTSGLQYDVEKRDMNSGCGNVGAAVRLRKQSQASVAGFLMNFKKNKKVDYVGFYENDWEEMKGGRLLFFFFSFFIHFDFFFFFL